MRRAITIGFPHDEGEGDVIVYGSDVPLDVQKAELKKLKASSQHRDFREIILFEYSRGDFRSAQFTVLNEKEPKSTPPQKPAIPETPKTKKG